MAKMCSLLRQQGPENSHDKLQGINLTAETMQTNMSPLTWMTTLLNPRAKPQSNGAALLKKRTPPWNTVSMYMALFRRINMKQHRLEKQNFKKENGKCTNV